MDGGEVPEEGKEYLRKVRVRMKTTAANSAMATYPKMSSWRPSSVWVRKRCLSIQMMVA
jgi:hypothetical protein